MISPGFPAEMPFFTRGLALSGAEVIGIGDQPQGLLPDMARESLSAYIQVGSFADEAAIVEQVHNLATKVRIDRVESLWEATMLLAAKLRQMLYLPGMTIEQTLPFRDKEIMKQVLDSAGIRTPRHRRCRNVEEVAEAAEEIGFPIIVKPIAGAGSADTYRADSFEDLSSIVPDLRHVPQVSVEEFIEAEEFTFDAISSGGEVLYYNICWYRPRPLDARRHEWISPQTIALKDPDVDHLAEGKRMGFAVLEAMEFHEGFSHMEWYLKPDGEAVFGEIGGRPPGGRTVDIMNFSVDADLFRAWAEAVVHGRILQPIERKYNAASVFKRASGSGRIQRIEGLSRVMAEFGEHVVALDLLPIGAPRGNWLQTLVGDGMIIVRHPDLGATMEMADRIGSEVQLFAG